MEREEVWITPKDKVEFTNYDSEILEDIIKFFNDEIDARIKTAKKHIQLLKGYAPKTKKEAIIRNDQMDVYSIFVQDMKYMKQRINAKIEDIKEYEKNTL